MHRLLLPAVLFLGCVLCPTVAAGEETTTTKSLENPLERYRKYLDFNSLVKGGAVQPSWMPDGNGFWYADGEVSRTIIHHVDPVSNTSTPFFDTPRLRTAIAKSLGHEPPHQGVPFRSFSFVDSDRPKDVQVRFVVEGREMTMLMASYKILTSTPVVDDPRSRPQLIRKGFTAGAPDIMEAPSPDGRWFALEKDRDVWIRSSLDDRSERITNDGNDEVFWNVEGAAWAPDSFRLLASKADTKGVARVPVVHWLKTTEDVEWHPYTKAGGPMARTNLVVLDILTKKQVQIEGSGLPDHYYYVVGWRPDGSEVVFMRMHREFRKLELMAADSRTGASRIILTETSDTFIGALHFVVNWRHSITLLEDNERLVWLSERDGWNHLYLYSLEGKLQTRLTRGDFPVLRVVATDLDEGWVYFLAHGEEDPYDTHLYRVSLAGKGFARLTEAEGQHDVSLSPSKDYFVDRYSSPVQPPVTELRRADGNLLQVVSEADTSALEELDWTPPEEFVVKAADGETDLHGVLFRPPGFDPLRRYPVLDYIYNGPFTTWVPRTFLGGRAVQPRAYAQLGFVTLVVDGRGTPERGKAFQDVVYRKFGQHEIPDHAAALEGLAAERPWMDTDRVGIFGGSWGGYMTIRALVTHPRVYHAGVAVNPVSDLYDHASLPIEGYMGMPQNNREGYETGSSIALADQLRGKLLLIHGTSDVNATFSATMKMSAALIRAGKQHDLIVLPGANHWPTGSDQKYMAEALRLHFQEHLKPQMVGYNQEPNKTPAAATP